MKKLLILLLALVAVFAAGCTYINAPLSVDVEYANESAYTVGGGEISESVKEIDIEWVEESVTVEYCDGDALTISESADGEISEKLALRYLVEEGKLSVKFASNGRHKIKNLNKKLYVGIPRGTRLDKLVIDAVSGNVKVEADAAVLQIDTVSGEINARADAKDICVDTVSANVRLYLGNFSSLKVDSVSGNVNAYLPQKLGFKLSYSTVSGAFSSSLEFRKGKDYIRLDGENTMEVSTVSGNLSIDAADGNQAA